MKNRFSIKSLFLAMAVGAGVSFPVLAEDIDLYVNYELEQEEPKILFIFDTSGSMKNNAKTGNSCYEKKPNGQYKYKDGEKIWIECTVLAH